MVNLCKALDIKLYSIGIYFLLEFTGHFRPSQVERGAQCMLYSHQNYSASLLRPAGQCKSTQGLDPQIYVFIFYVSAMAF
jgi:hypothetical protein